MLLFMRYDFERDKEKLYEIVAERDGYWCYLCGKISNLSLHHISSRGQVAPTQLIKKNGHKYYRDDPRNLVLLCWNCHGWIQRNMSQSEKFFKNFPKTISKKN